MCAKANKKIKALLRIRNYLTPTKAKLLCNTFILPNFNYCPIVWMFLNKEGNTLINLTHRRTLRATLDDFSLSFKEMLEKTKQKTMPHEKSTIFSFGSIQIIK